MSSILTPFFLQCLGVVIGIIGFVYIYFKHVTFKYWSSRGIPQTDPVVPFGDLWPILTAQLSIGEYTRDIYLKFKSRPVVGMYSFFKPNLVIRDPDIMKFILTKEFSKFQDRGMFVDEKLEPLSGQLFLLPGARWKNIRNKLSPTFSSGKMKYMFAAVKLCAEQLSEFVAQEIQQTYSIEVKDLLGRFFTDVIASVAFGIECNSLKNSNSEFHIYGKKVFEPRPILNTVFALFPSALSFFGIRAFDKDCTDFFLKAFEDTVKYRTSRKIVRKDFLELLMQLMDKGYVQGDSGEESPAKSMGTDEKLTMIQAAAQAFGFWLAGFETSMTTTSFILYEMALHQDIQDKLSNEINDILKKNGDVTYECLAEMTYLHKVVSETLRKHPTVPTLSRQANQDVPLPGTHIVIPKGTSIVIPVYGLHADPEIYPDPEIFDPERFNQENISSRHHYSYLPFGEGPRNCIGMRFGYLQTKMGIVTLLSKYRFLPAPDTQVPISTDKGSFVHTPEGNVTLRIETR